MAALKSKGKVVRGWLGVSIPSASCGRWKLYSWRNGSNRLCTCSRLTKLLPAITSALSVRWKRSSLPWVWG